LINESETCKGLVRTINRGFELEVHIIPHPSDNTSSTMKRAATVFLLGNMPLISTCN